MVDISDPTNPTSAGSCLTPGTAADVAISGDYAYVADYTSGLQVIDIRDPTNPSSAGSYLTPGLAVGIALSGDYAYVADGDSGLQVVDISNPADPTYGGSYSTPGYAEDVALSGDYAYVAGGNSGLQVIDISHPTNPTYAGSYNTPDIAFGVALSGDYAYVTDVGSGLQVIDIADAVPPTYAGGYDTPGLANGVALSGDYAYVADGSTVQALNIINPTNPTYEGSYNTPGRAFEVAVDGDYAYVADYDSGLAVLDISDPASPTYVGTHHTPDYAHAVAVSGNYAYVADYHSGLQVIDISDPTSPDSGGSFDMPPYAWGIAVSGDYAYVADASGGLQVIDISDPTSPDSGGSYLTPGWAEDVAISGNYAYVADRDFGLEIINISDPISPYYGGSYDTPGWAKDVAISGNYAYVADANSGLHVIDIGDPENPDSVGSYDTPGSACGVAIGGDYAFVADAYSGLQVIEVYQRRLKLQAHVAQSFVIDKADDEVLGARVTTAQSDSIRWELSADGGSSWQAILPGGAYEAFIAPGSNLLWKSTHIYAGGGINPTGSDLEIEWLYEFPVIESATDIPNDQGKQVSLSWVRSGNDYVGSPTPIMEYAVYRKIDEDLGTALQSGASWIGDNLGDSHRPRRSRIREVAAESWRDNPQGLLLYPPGQWHFIMTVPASAEDEYAVVVPTLADSTISGGMYHTTFFVRALTDTPGIHFDAYPDSGYSIDNLAPAAPLNLTMPSTTDLSWDESEEDDFNYFTVYGSGSADLDSTATLIGYTVGMAMDVTGDVYAYYHVTATDFSGNEGEASSVLNTYAGVKDVESLPTVYALKQNRPNPFESTTLIAFDLPEPGAVRLEIVDVQGRVVRVLTDEAWPAGRHSVAWTGENGAGGVTGPGVYFVRMHAGDFTARNKMLLMK